MSPLRMFPTTPLVKLGDKDFAKVKDFLSRFATIPDILELDHLTVSGDVTFGRNVSLKVSFIIVRCSKIIINYIVEKLLNYVLYLGHCYNNCKPWR